MTSAKVLIIGAGPVGLTMAAELARYGVGVRVIDKAPLPTDKSKAVVVWSRTLELLDRMGCADQFIAAGITAKRANLIAAADQALCIDFSLLDSPFPYALMLPQRETERLLADHLRELDVHVERAVELTAFRQESDGISASLRHADGTIEETQADWLIGCDGAHSAVRKLLDERFAGHTFPTEWLMADLHLTGLPTPSDEPALHFHGDGVLALFPLGPNNFFRLAANLGPALEEGRGRDVSLTEIQALLARRGPAGLAARDCSWHATFRINERQVRRYRHGRIFLAGDAAHIHSPAGGQGMNTGMQDAANLAWKLALICRGEADDARLLDSYHEERSEAGLRALQSAGRMTWLGLLRHPLAQWLRNRFALLLMRRRPVQRLLASQLAGLTVRYRRSPLNGANLSMSALKAGQRYPSSRSIAPDPQPRYRIAGHLPADEMTELAEEFPTLLSADLLPAPTEQCLYLIRPDFYVALAVGTGGTAAIRDYLRPLASPTTKRAAADGLLQPAYITEQ